MPAGSFFAVLMLLLLSSPLLRNEGLVIGIDELPLSFYFDWLQEIVGLGLGRKWVIGLSLFVLLEVIVALRFGVLGLLFVCVLVGFIEFDGLQLVDWAIQRLVFGVSHA